MSRAARHQPDGIARVFLTREETAHALCVSVTTVDRLIKSGRLRAAKIGRRVVCSPQAIEDFRKYAEAAEWGEAS
jgi:excisionase family DNA binding protein